MKNILLWCCLCITLGSKSQDVIFQHITANDGLGHNIIYSVAQDSIGFVWIATRNGIHRYTGYYINDYNSAIGNGKWSPILQVNKLKNLDNEIWAVSKNGQLLRYLPLKDCFQKYDLPEKGQIIDLTKIDNTIFLITYDQMYAFDLTNEQIHQIEIESGNLKTITNQGNILWIGTDAGIRKYKVNLGGELIFEKSYLTGKAVSALCAARSGKLFIGTVRDMLFCIDVNDKVNFFNFSGLKQPIYIRSITDSPDGNITIGTDGNGVLIINQEGEVLENMIHDQGNENSLSTNTVYDVYYDRQNRLWVSTFGGGINLFDPNTKKFSTLKNNADNLNSLGSNTVKRIWEDRSGNIWIGTQSGISLWKRKSNSWTHFTRENGRLNNNTVLCLSEGTDGKILAGTYGGGINIIDPITGNTQFVTSYQLQGVRKEIRYVYATLVDNEGDLWFSEMNRGVILWKRKSNKYMYYDITAVRTLIQLSNGDILAGSINGLFQINKNTGKSDRILHSLFTDVNLESDYIYVLYEDKLRNLIWLGTEGGGLVKYNHFTKEIKVFNTMNGFPSNVICGICAANDSNLWLSTYSGIIRFNPENQKIDRFDVRDGLSDNVFTFGAFLGTSTGEVFAGGGNGVSYFKTKEITPYTNVPNAFLSVLRISGKEIRDSLNNPKVVHPNYLKEIVLPHNRNNVTIRFEAIEFTNYRKNQYKWILEGLDEEWSSPSFSRQTIYSNLSPGNYRFKLMVSNCDGVWSKNIKELGIVIMPPFYARWWAYCIYVILFCSIVYFAFSYARIKIRERYAKNKMRLFTNLAHDIRTPLSLIKFSADNLSNHKKNNESTEDLIAINRNINRLNHFVSQLLDFQKADHEQTPNAMERLEISPFIIDIINDFKPILQQRKLNLTTHLNEQLYVHSDRFSLQRIFYNLLSNAVKYTPDGGDISIRSFRKGGIVEIDFSDTGIGIPKEQHKEMFKRFFRAENTTNRQEPGSGLGLALSKRLVEQLNGSISFTSELGTGSSFVVVLPYNDAPLKPLSNSTEIMIPEEVEQDLEEKKYTLLLVEDNNELRKQLYGRLINKYHVLEASDGEEGLQKVYSDDIDLIITDIMMPVKTGMELCKILKSSPETSHIPLIMLTALSSEQHKLIGLETGADAFVEKPFDIQILEVTISNLLKMQEILYEKYRDKGLDVIKENIKVEADREFLARIEKIIIENLSEIEFSVQTICDDLAMSRPVIFRKLKTLTGLSVKGYITKVKMEKAREMLISKKYSITQVAYECGFSAPQHFAKAFKKHFGNSPSFYTS